MKLMVYVLNDVHQLDKFLVALKDEKIKGATIINSTGMGRMLSESDDMNILGSLKFLFDFPEAVFCLYVAAASLYAASVAIQKSLLI